MNILAAGNEKIYHQPMISWLIKFLITVWKNVLQIYITALIINIVNQIQIKI
jgi:hypothetical protein